MTSGRTSELLASLSFVPIAAAFRSAVAAKGSILFRFNLGSPSARSAAVRFIPAKCEADTPWYAASSPGGCARLRDAWGRDLEGGAAAEALLVGTDGGGMTVDFQRSTVTVCVL